MTRHFADLICSLVAVYTGKEYWISNRKAETNERKETQREVHTVTLRRETQKHTDTRETMKEQQNENQTPEENRKTPRKT